MEQEKKLAKESIGHLVPDAAAFNETPVVEAPALPPINAPQWVTELLEQQKALTQVNVEFQNKILELEKDNKMFREMAGKNQIKGWEESQRDFTKKFAHLKVWNGKPIVEWKKLDMSKRNPFAKDAVAENIFIPVVYKDGSEELINYSDFTNIKDLMKVLLLNEVKQGMENVTCKFEDESVMTLGIRFLNA